MNGTSGPPLALLASSRSRLSTSAATEAPEEHSDDVVGPDRSSSRHRDIIAKELRISRCTRLTAFFAGSTTADVSTSETHKVALWALASDSDYLTRK